MYHNLGKSLDFLINYVRLGTFIVRNTPGACQSFGGKKTLLAQLADRGHQTRHSWADACHDLVGGLFRCTRGSETGDPLMVKPNVLTHPFPA